MSADESWRNRLALYGAENLSAMDKWRMDAAQREEGRVQTKEEMKREQERHERSLARAGAREEIAKLEQRLAAVEQQLANFNELANATVAFSTAVDSKLAELQQLLTRHAELRPAESPQPKGFGGFAREKSNDEVVDLPDFVRKMN
jgi:hypothetical protein